jgi:hypothetical protein
VRSLEVRIPISPRPDYFMRVRLIAMSIREFYPHAVITVSVGADTEPYDLEKALPWSAGLGVEWAWVPRAEFTDWRNTAHPYIATMMQRFRPPFAADRVLMIDADVIVLKAFDELFAERDSIAGVMAHGSPFAGVHQEQWTTLFRGYELSDPVFEHEHSGWGTMISDPAVRLSPPYFNTGVLFAPAAMLVELYPTYMDALEYVRATMDSYYFEQIALTLAMERAGLPATILAPRYNYPNQTNFDEFWPGELNDLRLLHFLRTEIGLVQRRDLTGSNELLRRRIVALLSALGVRIG